MGFKNYLGNIKGGFKMLKYFTENYIEENNQNKFSSCTQILRVIGGRVNR